MPTYEYLCEKCEHEFEREQRISDPPVKTCPKCRSRKVTRLISRTSFVLKGGGWYSDLYSSSKGDGDKDKDKKEKKEKKDGGGDGGASDGAAASTAPKDEPKKGKKSEGKPSASKKSAA